MLRRPRRVAHRDLRPSATSTSSRAARRRGARGPATVRAGIGADGRVERRLDGRPARGRPDGDALAGTRGWSEPLGESARAVYLFGAGHVGRALALALAPLPFAVRWIDSRREAFPTARPGQCRA